MAAKKSESLSEAVSHLLEECRMVLPGIQALFGFQLVAVFNQRFEQIPYVDQVLHLAAVALIALSVGLVMTPAAFHREVEPSAVSERFLKISTLFLLGSMLFLALGISVDFFIIAAMILASRAVPALAAGLLLFALVCLWFVFPFSQRR
jgi:hypothetical protein